MDFILALITWGLIYQIGERIMLDSTPRGLAQPNWA